MNICLNIKILNRNSLSFHLFDFCECLILIQNVYKTVNDTVRWLNLVHTHTHARINDSRINRKKVLYHKKDFYMEHIFPLASICIYTCTYTCEFVCVTQRGINCQTRLTWFLSLHLPIYSYLIHIFHMYI